MSPRLARRVPLLICGGVLGIVWLLQLASWWCAERMLSPQNYQGFRSAVVELLGLAERLELGTYDSRMRLASRRYADRSATNFGLLGLDEESLTYVATNSGHSWPLPRFYYGLILEELRNQGVGLVAFDILFAETNRNTPDTQVRLPDGSEIGSDGYFARAIGRQKDVILSALPKPTESGLAFPAATFGTNAAGIGNASRVRELDAVVRRVRPFVDVELSGGRRARIWHAGFVLGAQHLGLDLSQSRLSAGRITLVDFQGRPRLEVPTDAHTNFLINWLIPAESEDLYYENFADVLKQSTNRSAGPLVNAPWRGRLAIVASVLAGNNVSDIGDTPLHRGTPLSGVYWNVANSLIIGQFVRKPSLPTNLGLLALLTLVPAFLSWRLRAWWATAAVAAFATCYTVFCVVLYLRTGWMFPIVLPVLGALF
ncbi:MAG TPA: CHASE2 domain-containing protein, partial [Verrucomicrobiota bacterium]|nr:CHASE2 domain-containing protein [Verrucomicrobiota bacterium]